MAEKLSFIQRLIQSRPGNWASDMESRVAQVDGRLPGMRIREINLGSWRHTVEGGWSPSTRLRCDTCGRSYRVNAGFPEKDE